MAQAGFRQDPNGLSYKERKALGKLGYGESREEGGGGEVHTFYDYPAQTVWMFNVRGIKDALAARSKNINPLVGWLTLTVPWYLQILEKSGVEDEHLERITEKRLATPLISVVWPDNTQNLIDGNHRYIKGMRLGMKELRVAVIHYNDWKFFVKAKRDPKFMETGLVYERSAKTEDAKPAVDLASYFNG